MKVVYILGSGHCGATLLDTLLGSHPAVVGTGEMHSAKPDAVCTCGKPARECPVWSAVIGPEPWPRQELFRPKLATLLGRGPYLSATSHQQVDPNAFGDRIIGQYQRLLQISGASVIVDSSKEPERTEVLSARPEIDPIVIHLVRDARGVTWSYVRKYKKLFPYLYLWAFSNLKVELFRRTFRGTFLFLRYEDLVADPEKTLRWLCGEIGIPYEPGMLEFRKVERHQIEGNRMRFRPGETIYRDEKWRRDMPFLLRATETALFGWLNLYYRHKRSPLTSWKHSVTA